MRKRIKEEQLLKKWPYGHTLSKIRIEAISDHFFNDYQNQKFKHSHHAIRTHRWPSWPCFTVPSLSLTIGLKGRILSEPESHPVKISLKGGILSQQELQPLAIGPKGSNSSFHEMHLFTIGLNGGILPQQELHPLKICLKSEISSQELGPLTRWYFITARVATTHNQSER